MLEGGRRWLVAGGVLGWLYSGASGGVLWQKRGSSRAAKARQHGPAKLREREEEKSCILVWILSFFLLG